MKDRRTLIYISSASGAVLPTPAGIKCLGTFLQSIADTEVPIDTVIDGIHIQITPQVKCRASNCFSLCDVPGGRSRGYTSNGFCSRNCEDWQRSADAEEANRQMSQKGT